MTATDPRVLAQFFVPRLPMPRSFRTELAADNWRSWLRGVTAFARLRGVEPVLVPCRVAAIVRDVVGPRRHPVVDATLVRWREAVGEAMARSGLANKVMDVRVDFEPLVATDPAEWGKLIGTEIVIVEVK